MSAATQPIAILLWLYPPARSAHTGMRWIRSTGLSHCPVAIAGEGYLEHDVRCIYLVQFMFSCTLQVLWKKINGSPVTNPDSLTPLQHSTHVNAPLPLPLTPPLLLPSLSLSLPFSFTPPLPLILPHYLSRTATSFEIIPFIQQHFETIICSHYSMYIPIIPLSKRATANSY